jgi:murein DD-endopeptidase MepM/ murein hydrolase activator NlpD
MLPRFSEKFNNLAGQIEGAKEGNLFTPSSAIPSIAPLSSTKKDDGVALEKEGFVRPVFIGSRGERVVGDINKRFAPRSSARSEKNKALAEMFNKKAFSISPSLKGWAGSYKEVRPPVSTGVSKLPSVPPTPIKKEGGEPIKPSAKFQNLIRNLGAMTTPWGGTTKFEKFHPALDVANKKGTPIPAFTGGVITSVVTGKKQGEKGYGNYVIVTDAQGNRHRYSHLHQSYVQVGQKVLPGQKLGAMGNTGSTYSTSGGDGTHLDYRITDARNKYINPNEFFAHF